MSPRTRDQIRDAAGTVRLLWAIEPGIAHEYVAGLYCTADPDSVTFHPQRLAAEAAENQLVALFVADMEAAL